MTPQSRSADDWAGRSCLITGAGGFIGRALSETLRSAGAEVHAFARAGCDVTDLSQVRAVVQSARPEVIFHLAGMVTGSRALDLVLPTLATNLLGTVHVLTAAAEAGATRVVCLGSLQEPDQVLPPVPPSPYAAAKFAAGAYARMFAEVFGLSVTIARPFMVYGPGQMDFSKVVPHILKRLLNGESPELSSGAQGFDWVYVDDVVAALLAVAARGDLAGRLIDVGTGVLTTVAQIASGLHRRVGASAPALRMGVIPDRRLEPTRVADVAATAASLGGWRPQVTVDEGLDRTVEWYRRHFRDR